MGISAYNRGSAAISANIDREARPVEFEIMERLNTLSKYPDAGRPFTDIQFVPDCGGFWAQCPATGYGFWYPSLAEAVRRWRVKIVGYDCGKWIAKAA